MTEPNQAKASNHDAGPLSGLRILAIEQFGAGPLGSLYLADLGAEVIKIEDPGSGGDVGRYVPPHSEASNSLYFEAFNRGKKSITLDLKSEAGLEVFRSLVVTADAVFSNLRGDLASSLGLTYETLVETNPRIVCVALTGYGSHGARAHLPAYDALIQAEVGWAAVTGDPSGPPVKSGLSLADYIGGLTAAIGLLASVIKARQTGTGGDVEVDLYRSALSMHTYPGTWMLTKGTPAPRQSMSAHPSIVPFQFFETSNGHIAIACAKDKFFLQLVETLGVAQLQEDAYSSFSSRWKHRESLLTILSEHFLTRDTDHWVALLSGKVPIAPARSMEDALNAEELRELGMLAEYESPVFGKVTSIGSPITLPGYIPQYSSAPALDGNRSGLLQDLGMGPEEVEELRRRGAFGNDV